MGNYYISRFPWWLSGKELVCSAEDEGLIPESGRSPGERNGNPLQYLAWEIPWTKEAGMLQSMGAQKGQTKSLATKQQQIIYIALLPHFLCDYCY